MTGLLDFGDMLRTYTVNELAVACAYAILGRDDPLAVAASITAGYHRARPLSGTEIKALFPLICLRLCVSVTRSAMAAKEDPQNAHRRISEPAAWEMLARLEGIDWQAAENGLRPA
jgi:Ser/Thr protein kinase RdoA (MazF antagonist)